MNLAKWKSGFFSILPMIKALIGNREKNVLRGLFCFLWFFYGAIADRIFPTIDAVLEKDPGILNPRANWIAISSTNLLVLLFPFMSFALVILIHHYWKQRGWLWVIFICILLFDTIVALVSSKEIHDHLESQGYERSWSLFFGWKDYFAHVWIVILCGFGASFVAGLLYHALYPKSDTSTDTDTDTDTKESPDTESPDTEIED